MPSEPTSSEPRPKVLLVDDHVVILQAYRRLLSTSCEIVGCASNSRDALEMVATLKPDVVVADLFLPDGNGIDLCRDVRLTAPHPRVVLLSAADNPEIEHAARLSGAFAFVPKLSAAEDLERAIVNAASEKR
jgi:DNA-binding NarL/FixJ family response regulator